LQGAAMQPWAGSQISAAWQAPLSGVYAQASASSSHESVVQATESSQITAVPAAQEPAEQTSVPLQYKPSSQSLSTLQGAVMQPWTGSQISAAWQAPWSCVFTQASASSSH
jgi:hypothetical protein